MRRIGVLIVDDSAVMRHLLTGLLECDPGIAVVGTAANPMIAREKIKLLNPDVITLDIEMPGMDGISFLSRIMALRPMPVIMVSTLTEAGAEATLQALEMGAVDFVTKPASGIAETAALGAELCAKIKAAAAARLAPRPAGAKPHGARDRLAPEPSGGGGGVIAIGASTGGVEALSTLLPRLPQDAPPILLVQHMPAPFTTSFAQRLDRACALRVGEAREGEGLRPGHVYLAPGDRHLLLARACGQYVCALRDTAPVNGHRPSVDVLFHSVVAHAPAGAVGVLLTGMGRDGAEGLLALRRAGAPTIAQSEQSCVVYGMPKAAVQMGAVGEELPLERIAPALLRLARAGGARAA